MGEFFFIPFLFYLILRAEFDGGGKVEIEKEEVQSMILGILALITLAILILILLGVLR